MEDLAKIRKVLGEDPDNPEALRAAARHYLKEGDYRRCQKVYLSALARCPSLLAGIILDYEEEIARCPEKIGARLSLTGFLLAGDNVDSAVLELEEELEEHPQSIEAYNLLGRIYIKQERIDDAIALLERSLLEGIKDVNLTETLAWAYLEKGRISEAVKFYEEILEQKPKDKQTLRILGELYSRREDFSRAAQYYEAMFSEDPEVVREVIQRLEDLLKKVEGNVEIREILADIYMKALNPEEAVGKLRELLLLEPSKMEAVGRKLKSILKNYPGLPSASLLLAEVLVKQRNFSEAVEYYHQLSKARPEFIGQVMGGYRAILEVCPDQVLARSHLGEALLAQNSLTEALEEYGKMIAADPSVADTVVRKCREVLKEQPRLLPVHVVLGQAYLAKGDFQRAAMEAEGVIANDKKASAAYLLLGEAYAALNLLHKASETLRTALTVDPFNLQIHEKYREYKGKEIEYETNLLKGRLQEDQWKTSLHWELAKKYLEMGRREEATRELQIAAKEPLRTALAHNLLGNIYRWEGRFDLALAQYSRALESANPELSKTVRFNLGSVHEAQGQVKKAIKIYEDILREEVEFGNLKNRVKQLKSSSLASMRSRSLLAVMLDCGGRELIALWGREVKSGLVSGQKEEISVSFGQEHNQEGFEYFIKGMYQAAEEEFSLAVQLDRNFGVALNNLGVVLARSGRLNEARAKLAEAVEANPASAVFYNNLGVVYFLLGQMDSAGAALEKSLTLNGEAAATWINLGDYYYFKQEAEKALEFYRRVGSFDPLSDIAAQRLLYKVA